MANPQRTPLAFTLRAHLLAFAAAILLPVLVLTAALLFNSAQLERTQIEARLDQVVDDLAEDTDRYLSNLVSILQTLATSPALQAGDLEAFHLQASAAARSMTTWVSLPPPVRYPALAARAANSRRVVVSRASGKSGTRRAQLTAAPASCSVGLRRSLRYSRATVSLGSRSNFAIAAGGR